MSPVKKKEYTMSQLLEVDDLPGRLTTDENRVLFAALTLFPLLQHKLRLLVQMFRLAPIIGKLVLQTTVALSLFHTQRNLSQLFWKNNIYFQSIKIPPSYATPYLNGSPLLMHTRYSHSPSCRPK
jgi:hypothetical protein